MMSTKIKMYKATLICVILRKTSKWSFWPIPLKNTSWFYNMVNFPQEVHKILIKSDHNTNYNENGWHHLFPTVWNIAEGNPPVLLLSLNFPTVSYFPEKMSCYIFTVTDIFYFRV